MKINTTQYGVCDVVLDTYKSNDNLAVKLVDADGMPVVFISTNIIPLMDGQFCANNNNIGFTLWNDIMQSGFFKDTGETVGSGYCTYPIMELVTSDVA